jgi:transcriptional regulator with XRE-family HTH domain
MNGAELRQRRDALGWSQETLARALSVTRQTVYMWERGKTAVPPMVDLALRWLEQAAAGGREARE